MVSRVARVYFLPKAIDRSWWGDAVVLLDRVPLRQHYLAHGSPPLVPPVFASSSRGLFTSVLFHIVAVALLLHMPGALLVRETAASAPVTTVTYHVPLPDPIESPPNIKPLGPGGAPGSGNRPESVPARGSTAFHKRWTIVSNPPNPDNHRQTVIQPLAPPEIRIPEVTVPNLLLGGAPKRLRRPLSFSPPSLAPRPNLQPPQSAVEPPRLSSEHSAADLSLLSSNIANPRLPVPAPVEAPPTALPNAQTSQGTDSVGQNQPLADGDAGLLALNLGNASTASSLTLPLGNRYGAFSISPTRIRPGSPGGVEGGHPQGGIGGGSSGGDSSTGVGPGSSGGGGGAAGALTDLPISLGGGENGGRAPALTLLSSFTQSQMFPVVFPPRLRSNALVISTGPIGGGGLHVYGVLKGGKIHTVYLPMPGKNWILQYCLLSESPAHTARPPASVRVQLDQGLAAPSPIEGFDFKRPKPVRQSTQPYIILHGVIAEDGSVRQLRVHQGVQQDADQLALLTFSRWRFQPALRAAKPTAVEVLVGIPIEVAQE